MRDFAKSFAAIFVPAARFPLVTDAALAPGTKKLHSPGLLDCRALCDILPPAGFTLSQREIIMGRNSYLQQAISPPPVRSGSAHFIRKDMPSCMKQISF
jgi:hypothetical protein